MAVLVVGATLLAGCADDDGDSAGSAAMTTIADSTQPSAGASSRATLTSGVGDDTAVVTTVDSAADAEAAEPSPTTPSETTAPPLDPAATTESPSGRRQWSHDFEEPDGTSLMPPFQVATAFDATLVTKDGHAVMDPSDYIFMAAFLRGEPTDPTNCFAETTYNPSLGGSYGPIINHTGPASGEAGNAFSGYYLGWYQGDTTLRLWEGGNPTWIGQYDIGAQLDRDVTFRLERRADSLLAYVDGELRISVELSEEQVQRQTGTWVGMMFRYSDDPRNHIPFQSFVGGDL